MAQGLPAGTQRDVQYGEAGGEKLLLDVYGADAKIKRPALLLIHGGAWREGSRKDLAGAAITFARQGYVCFSLGYRLIKGDTNRYPAQIDDVQRAVRWVRAHSTQYGVIPDKIGALGMSAGGHLVALLGTMDTRDNSDPELAPYSSRVQCVVDLYGPTDFTAALLPTNQDGMTAAATPGAQLVRDFLGPLPEAASNYKEASPITHIDKNTAPFLIFHGAKDTLVPLDQSQRFDKALREAGIETKLVVFPNAGHAYGDPELIRQTVEQSVEFFNRHLKK
jgi:acetyl esterase/lipase